MLTKESLKPSKDGLDFNSEGIEFQSLIVLGKKEWR